MSKQVITDSSDLRKYRTELPNMADDDLDPFQYRLYGHYKRVCGANGGTCTESVRTTATKCKMSAEKIIEVRQWLADNGWIAQEAQENAPYLITILDRWGENFARYSECPLDIPNRALEIPNATVRNSETKNKPIKNKPIKKDIPAAQAASEPTEHQQMFEKVCEIVGLDYKVIDEKAKGQVAQTLGILKKGGYTIEHLSRFGKEVWVNDWRWIKHRQRPSLKDLRTEIGKLTAKPLLAKDPAADWGGVPTYMLQQQENFYA